MNVHAGSAEYADEWSRIIEIHNHTKSVFLCAEEFDSQFLDFVQPVLELRNAFEHIIRLKAAELGINNEKDADSDNYIPHSFNKALGHEYRAFFDAADWFSVCIRERIIKILTQYSSECIDAVLPNYYSELRPAIDKTCQDIAKIRGAKDVSKSKDLLVEVNQYRKVIEQLLEIYEQIMNSVPSLVDWNKRSLKSKIISYISTAVIGGVICSFITAWVLHYIGP
jgi:hypothetical protein